MAQVADSSGRQPRELSVAGTVQALAAFAKVLDTADGYHSFVWVVLAHRVGNRPDRIDPRAAEATTRTGPAARRTESQRPKTAHTINLRLQEVPTSYAVDGFGRCARNRSPVL